MHSPICMKKVYPYCPIKISTDPHKCVLEEIITGQYCWKAHKTYINNETYKQKHTHITQVSRACIAIVYLQINIYRSLLQSTDIVVNDYTLLKQIANFKQLLFKLSFNICPYNKMSET